MATTTLNTKIKLRYDTLANWQNTSVEGKGGNLVLLKGEVAFCEVPAAGTPGGNTVNDTGAHNYRPTVLFKVGAEDTNGQLQAFKDLPWGSALAADVYSWAKEASKPSYSASEISITDADGNTNTTNVEAALAEIYELLSALQGDETSGLSLTSLKAAIDTLNNVDSEGTPYTTPVNGSVAKAVADEAARIDGIIGTLTESTVVAEIAAVEDKIDDFADIQNTTGTANASGNVTVVTNVSKDANNKLSVEKTQVNLGSAARRDAVATSHTITDADAAVATKVDDLVSAAQVAAYVMDRTAALTGATHFKGALTVGQNETAADVLAAISNPTVGDIYLVGTAEYIYNDDATNDGANAGWVLLGDEGIYATKAYVDGQLNNKVDKNGTDRLMTADEGTKLAGIETGAEVNVIETITANGQTFSVSNKTVDLGDLAAKDEVAYGDLASALATDIDGKLDGVSAGIASVSNDIVTIKGGLTVDSTTVAGTNTVVNTANTNDITLAKVAKTGMITDLDLGDGLILDGGNAEIPAQQGS